MQFLQQSSYKLSQTDSLKQTINFLEQRIDSLAKHTQVNEIGQNFFSDAISRDLYMFSTIVVIAGLVSWATIATMLRIHKTSVEKKSRAFISEAMSNINGRITILEHSINGIEIDVNRAMYISNKDSGFYDQAFNWALDVIRCGCNYHSGNKAALKEHLDRWLDSATSMLDKLSPGDEYIADRCDEMVGLLNEVLPEIHDSKNIEDCKKLLKKLKNIGYSNPIINIENTEGEPFNSSTSTTP
ncbi:MAG: hypothetical protein EOO20_03800 [Chryseobacterium sp.]|nr:MAG: hypothetical protein EOO20_03800 [Chryseobacterium sp.]